MYNRFRFILLSFLMSFFLLFAANSAMAANAKMPAAAAPSAPGMQANPFQAGAHSCQQQDPLFTHPFQRGQIPCQVLTPQAKGLYVTRSYARQRDMGRRGYYDRERRKLFPKPLVVIPAY